MMESKSAAESPREFHAGESVSGGETRRLRATLQAAFRDASIQYADAPTNQQLDLRAALRQVCADARHAGLRAEELLVLIKEVWSALPAGISRLPAVHGDERLNYVISTCVDEYYAPFTGEQEVTP